MPLKRYKNGEAIFKICAKKTLEKETMWKRDERKAFSIKYQILDASTSLFVAEKVVDKVSHKVHLRKVPLVVINGEYFLIFIKGLTGRCFTLNVTSHNTVAELRSMCEDAESTPADELRIICTGI